jgi:hypothetical protein
VFHHNRLQKPKAHNAERRANWRLCESWCPALVAAALLAPAGLESLSHDTPKCSGPPKTPEINSENEGFWGTASIRLFIYFPQIDDSPLQQEDARFRMSEALQRRGRGAAFFGHGTGSQPMSRVRRPLSFFSSSRNNCPVMTWKWRCGASVLPELPSSPSTWPVVTLSPGLTRKLPGCIKRLSDEFSLFRRHDGNRRD